VIGLDVSPTAGVWGTAKPSHHPSDDAVDRLMVEASGIRGARRTVRSLCGVHRSVGEERVDVGGEFVVVLE
jgi:hypothetical protein